MRQVQEALKDIGIPVWVGAFKTDAINRVAPKQYCVYSTTMIEEDHADDVATCYKTFVYLDLHSEIDPTDMIRKIRSAMNAAGFSMAEETDKGYNRNMWNDNTRLYEMQWTWVYREELTDGR